MAGEPQVPPPPIAPWAESVEPVFLVGCPRSGTTWVQAMLAEHRDVHTGPETHFFSSLSPTWELLTASDVGRNVGLSAYWTTEQFTAEAALMFRRMISRLPTPESRPRVFLEKSPQHGRHGDFILSAFPGARFVHVLRDARSTIASLMRVSDSWGRHWAPNGVDDAAHFWSRHVRSCRALVARLGPDRAIEIRYEDLRSSPAGGLERLLAFLDLDTDAAAVTTAVEKHALRGEVAGFGSIPAVGNDYPVGFVGPAPASGRDAALDNDEILRIEQLVGPLLTECGYPDVRTRFSVVERMRLRRRFFQAGGA